MFRVFSDTQNGFLKDAPESTMIYQNLDEKMSYNNRRKNGSFNGRPIYVLIQQINRQKTFVKW